MSRSSAPQVILLQVRVAVPAVTALRAAAAQAKRPVSHVCRDILEDHIQLFGMPKAMQDVLEKDRKARQLDRRGYYVEALADRYRVLLEARCAT
jgi:hypothetical protein